MFADVLLQGDHFSWIDRNRSGVPVGFLPMPHDATVVHRRDGRNVYAFTLGDRRFVADQDDVLHIPGLGFDGERSLSPIRHAARQSVGLALATEEYSARFFSNGAKPDVVLEAPERMDRDQAEMMRDFWIKKVSGLVNAHLPAVLTQGVTAHELTMSAKDSQLLESRQFQVIDIARIYGVPPHMVGVQEKSTSWGSGIEQQNIGFVTFTLSPHLRRAEQELARKLFSRPGTYAEFQVASLLRGDSDSRAKFYREAIGGSQGPGWMTVNEVRALENLSKIDGGDAVLRFETSGGPAPAA